MNARELLSTKVQSAFPLDSPGDQQVTVIPYVSDPTISGRTILVHATRVVPHPGAPQAAREWTCELWCLVSSEVGSLAVEDELEDLMLTAVEAIEHTLSGDGFVLQEAVRGSFEQRAPAWRITCTVPITR